MLSNLGDTMLDLKDNPILTPYQLKILRLFFHSPLGKQFFLTGGTALAAFYLAHRLSKDLDLFTLEDFDTLLLEKIIAEIAAEAQATVETKVKTKSYYEIYLNNQKANWLQRLDFVREQPVIFGKRQKVDFITVDSLENIASGKILTVYSRLEAKDYLDLYFIFKETDLNFFQLFEKTKQKDLGLDEFYFSDMIAQVESLKNYPKTLKPYSKKELNAFFLDLSNQLYQKIKPEE